MMERGDEDAVSMLLFSGVDALLSFIDDGACRCFTLCGRILLFLFHSSFKCCAVSLFVFSVSVWTSC